MLDDPPFCLDTQSSSSGSNTCALHSERLVSEVHPRTKSEAPTRSLLAQMESDEYKRSEDFRSVIDDLTIQNKKLRRKLRRYEKLHCSHWQEEKLFEVRIHGLAAHRKRELEEILRSFASQIEEETIESPFPTLDPSQHDLKFRVAPTHLPPLIPVVSSILHKPLSSSASCSKLVDSAYASMSGQTGSNSHLRESHHPDRTAQVSQAKQQNVKSYLRDIPEVLLPKHSLTMSDRSKSKLIVRRLEQIFTGRGAAVRRHNQSYQQQEISCLAAQADWRKTEYEDYGRKTIEGGMREAQMLSGDMELHIESSKDPGAPAICSQASNDGYDSRSWATHASRDGSLNQRPTCPLDLDLHRAQVPQDNIEYIRHLGLASPTDVLDSNQECPDTWVYLNLLTSMAQIHTLNVTPEFIRTAVANDSSRFDLSPDSSKVRWLGGHEGTTMSSDSDESEDQVQWRPSEKSRSVSKPSSYAGLSSKAEIDDRQEPNSALPIPISEPSVMADVGAKRRPMNLGNPDGNPDFQYKPLFFHDMHREEEISSDASGSVMVSEPMDIGTGNGSSSNAMNEAETRTNARNTGDGPIVFYYKARFCTDLSGDANNATSDRAAYSRYTEQPIGCLPLRVLDEKTNDTSSDGDQLSDSVSVNADNSPSLRSALDLEDLRSSISDCASMGNVHESSPMHMEVSGLAGIEPEDHFLIDVKARYSGHRTPKTSIPPPFAKPSSYSRHFLRQIPHKFMKLSQEPADAHSDNNSQFIRTPEIISAIKTSLTPSTLPPPSFICLPFSSGSDDEEEDGDEMDASSTSRRLGASIRPPVDFVREPTDLFIDSPGDGDNESSYVATSDGSDDSSIDLLAHARESDPDAIAAREREFDISAIQQLAELPTGSSAARVGGRSGCGSEGSGAGTGAESAESDVDSMDVDGDERSDMDGED